MAIKFKGDTTVAIINSIKKAEVDTVYRCFDSGVLLSNEVINHGDFVSWDGTKWIKRPDLSYLIDNSAAPIDQQIMSNIAPAYVKQPYPANSYVTKGGVLYTNPNAIGTAEDWNPEHWTQTTVAEMMAGAGGSTGYTQRNVNVSVEDNVHPLAGVSNRSVTVASINDYQDLPWEITIDNDCTDAVIILRTTVNDLAALSIKINRINGTQLTLYGIKGQMYSGTVEDAGSGFEFFPYFNGISSISSGPASEILIHICGDTALLSFTVA